MLIEKNNNFQIVRVKQHVDTSTLSLQISSKNA